MATDSPLHQYQCISLRIQDSPSTRRGYQFSESHCFKFWCAKALIADRTRRRQWLLGVIPGTYSTFCPLVLSLSAACVWGFALSRISTIHLPRALLLAPRFHLLLLYPHHRPRIALYLLSHLPLYQEHECKSERKCRALSSQACVPHFPVVRLPFPSPPCPLFPPIFWS
ncbi:hypothetical protein DFH06DRAFT_521223 [Mycena polygramma]|nr:hypothetical protein DFH06DRAFT_521223 [Mycena polygramma]